MKQFEKSFYGNDKYCRQELLK